MATEGLCDQVESLDDNALFDRVRKSRCKDAFAELSSRMRPTMRAFAVTDTPGEVFKRMSPEDVIQAAVMLAYRDIDNFYGETVGSFRSWIMTILKNRVKSICAKHVIAGCRSVYRERGVRIDSVANTRTDDRAMDPMVVASWQEFRDEVHGLLVDIPRDQAEAIRLRYIEGLTSAEVAVRMNRSVDAVGGLFKRGMKSLRESPKIQGKKHSDFAPPRR